MRWQTLTNMIDHKASIAPGQYSAGTTNGTAVAKGRARMAMVILNTGAVPSGSTIDVKLQGRVTAGTGSWIDVASTDSGSSQNLAFAQRTNATTGAPLYGLVPMAELPYEEYRAVGVVAGGSGAAYGVSLVLGDFPEYPYANPLTNAFAAKVGVGARIDTAGALNLPG